MDTASALSSIFAGSSHVVGRLYVVIKSMPHYKARRSYPCRTGPARVMVGQSETIGDRVGPSLCRPQTKPGAD